MRGNSTTNSLRCSPRRLRLRRKGAPQPTRLYLRRRQLVLSSAPAVAHRLSPIAPLSRASATRAPSSWLAEPSRFRTRAQRPTTHSNYSQAPVFCSAPRSAASAKPPLPPPLGSAWRTRARLAPLRGAFFSMSGRTLGRVALLQVCASSPRRDARLMRGLVAAVDGAQRPQRRRASLGLAGRRGWWWSSDERGERMKRHGKQKKKISRRCGCGWAAAAPLLAAVAAGLVVAGGVCRSQLVVGGCDRLADCGSRPALRSAPAPMRPLYSAPPSRASTAVGACRGHALPTAAATRDANAGALISRQPPHAEKNPRKNLAKDVRRWYNNSREEVGQCQHQQSWKRLANVAPK